MPPSRSFRYHVYDDLVFDGQPALSAQPVNVIRFDRVNTDSRQMYSLVRDMNELRRIGVAKGIVDAAVTQNGTSSGGRSIPAIKIGNGTGHRMLVVGCHHAREWIAAEMAYYIAEYLVNTYTNTPQTPEQKRIKHLLMNRQIWFIPIANPDGHIFTMTGNRNWRPTRAVKTVSAGSTTLADGSVRTWLAGLYRGVDMNRNYGTANWGTETPATTNEPPSPALAEDSVWCGLGPSSGALGEPESRAIDALISPAPGFRGVITFHSYGEQWLWAGPRATGSGSAFVDWIGNGLVSVMGSVGHAYAYTGGPTPYLTSGDMADFAAEHAAGRPVFTPEVRPTRVLGDPNPPVGIGFSFLPESEIEPCFVENLAATLGLINCAGHNSEVATQSLSTATGYPPQRCQFVKHCWEVFRNWRPYVVGKDI